MSRNVYKNFISLLKEWPADEARKGRDLGEFIRLKIADHFKRGENSEVPNLSECTKKFESLNRIAKNIHSKKYPRIYNSTALGAKPELCGKMLSNESLEEIGT